MDAIRALSVEIGPRPACSRAEQRASEWCAAQLSSLGFDVAVEEFGSRPSRAPWFAAYLATAAVGAAMIVVAPLVSLILGVAALVLYARDAEGRPLIRLRGGTSRNVIATRGDAQADLLVVACLDSARAATVSYPRVIHAALLVTPLAGAAAWVAQIDHPLPSALWIPSVALTVILVGALRSELRRPVAPDAHANASGVEVLMRLAGVVDDPSTWFVVTGSKGAGSVGAAAFFERHTREIGGARVLNIDWVGSGPIVVAEEEGILKILEADRGLVAAAEAAGAEARSFRLQTDAGALLARGMKAVTLLAVEDGDDVDPMTIERAVLIARAVISSVIGERTI